MIVPLLPPRPGISFLPHQEEGVRWMLSREEETAAMCRGGILGDDMGLGKTFQTIGLLKNSPFPMRTLIVCPPALISGWTAELTACGYAVSVMVKSKWTPTFGNTVWLTTYPKACRYRREIATATPAFERVVLDEGHVIRNGKKTARWMRCMAIGLRATCRWILSATPVQNGPSDWLHLCYWLRVRGVSDKEIMELSPTLMLRRTMADLRGSDVVPPAPRFVNREFLMSEDTEEGCLFRVLCDQLDDVIDGAATLVKLVRWMRIQQFLVHPQIYLDSIQSDGEWTGGATKWDACMSDMTESVRLQEGVIVFCQFRAEMDRVAAAARGMGATVCMVRGGMRAEQIGDAVRIGRECVERGEAVVMIVQIVAGGAGLNLQFCRRILFLSQHWNPAVVHQAVGRAVRIGQTASVTVVFYSVVNDVMDNLDMRMRTVHGTKIESARTICDSLYQGFFIPEVV